MVALQFKIQFYQKGTRNVKVQGVDGEKESNFYTKLRELMAYKSKVKKSETVTKPALTKTSRRYWSSHYHYRKKLRLKK